MTFDLQRGSPRILPYGDAALLVVLGARVEVRLNRHVHALARAVEAAGWTRVVPAYASLLVPYDPDEMDLATAADALGRVVEAAGPREKEPSGARPPDDHPPEPTSPIEIPVFYGGLDGPDLADVAALHDLTEQQVVELHASTPYHVFMIGFSPGFPYLGPLPEQLVTPRRATPRPRIPAGSVGIAGNQTGIYPQATPGGWQLIGRTEARLWDPDREPPSLLKPGDRVKFVPARVA